MACLIQSLCPFIYHQKRTLPWDSSYHTAFIQFSKPFILWDKKRENDDLWFANFPSCYQQWGKSNEKGKSAYPRDLEDEWTRYPIWWPLPIKKKSNAVQFLNPFGIRYKKEKMVICDLLIFPFLLSVIWGVVWKEQESVSPRLGRWVNQLSWCWPFLFKKKSNTLLST